MHPVFLDGFADYMANVLTTNHNIVIAGDFNLHINNQEDPEAQLFTDMMDVLGLDCHINFPTHQNGQSLDLVFTKALSGMKIIRCNPGTYLSDHCTIECLISLKLQCEEERGHIQKTDVSLSNSLQPTS